ncbi:hypothetical protein [Nocardia sp. NPDC047038]|uniref:hypothetical protein n=1 Tax=Nocardia sp. NPDC047038 TaxID=3154338 RepID=UPI0033D1B77C
MSTSATVSAACTRNRAATCAQYAATLYTGSLADYAAHFESLDPEAQHRLTVARDELRTWTNTYRLRIITTMAEDTSLHYCLAVESGDEWVALVIGSPS